MSEMYAGAVLFNDLYTSMHILNSIRAAIGSQCTLHKHNWTITAFDSPQTKQNDSLKENMWHLLYFKLRISLCKIYVSVFRVVNSI